MHVVQSQLQELFTSSQDISVKWFECTTYKLHHGKLNTSRKRGLGKKGKGDQKADGGSSVAVIYGWQGGPEVFPEQRHETGNNPSLMNLPPK